MERGIEIDLKVVPLGIVEIDRPGIAMIARQQVLDIPRDDPAIHGAQLVERLHQK